MAEELLPSVLVPGNHANPGVHLRWGPYLRSLGRNRGPLQRGFSRGPGGFGRHQRRDDGSGAFFGNQDTRLERERATDPRWQLTAISIETAAGSLDALLQRNIIDECDELRVFTCEFDPMGPERTRSTSCALSD